MLTQYPLVDHSPRIGGVLDDHRSGNNTNPSQYYLSRNRPRTTYIFQMKDKEIIGVPFVMVSG